MLNIATQAEFFPRFASAFSPARLVSAFQYIVTMDCRFALFICLAAILVLLVVKAEGRTKKVVIHVPYKVKKLKHTHTVYKTIHHHHNHYDHGPSTEEHEHFHHFHIHDENHIGQHSQPIAGIEIPEFLPDTPLDIDDLPAMRHKESKNPPRLVIPPYKRHYNVGPM